MPRLNRKKIGLAEPEEENAIQEEQKSLFKIGGHTTIKSSFFSQFYCRLILSSYALILD